MKFEDLFPKPDKSLPRLGISPHIWNNMTAMSMTGHDHIHNTIRPSFPLPLSISTGLGFSSETKIKSRYKNGKHEMRMSEREINKSIASLVAKEVMKDPALIPNLVFEIESNLTPLIMTALIKSELLEEAKKEFIKDKDEREVLDTIVWHGDRFLEAFPHYATLQELVE